MASFEELQKFADEYNPQQQQLGVNSFGGGMQQPQRELTPYEQMVQGTNGVQEMQTPQESSGLLGSIFSSSPAQQQNAEEPSYLGSFMRGAVQQGIGVLGGQADFLAGATGSETLRDLGNSAQNIMQGYSRPKEYTYDEITKNGLSSIKDYLLDPNGFAFDVGGGFGSSGTMMAEAALLSAALPAGAATAGTGAIATLAGKLGLKSVAAALKGGGTAAKLIKNVIASTPLEAASESGGTFREMTTDENGNPIDLENIDMDKVQTAMAKNFVGNLGVLGASNLLESAGIGRLFGDKMRQGILGKVRDIGAFMATNVGQNAWEEGAQTGSNLYAQGKIDNISQVVNPFEWNPEQVDAATIGGIAGFGQGAALGGAGHVMNRIAGNQQDGEQAPNPNFQINNAVTNNEFGDAVAIAKHDTSTNLVDRMRNLEGRIGYHASDGTNCARTVGLALAGTDYQDLINVDNFVEVAQNKGQLKDPASYVPKPGDLAVVNDGNHIVMVSENGGTIQNGSSHDGVYESAQSPLQMFGSVKYYISTSELSNGDYGVAGNLQGVNEEQRQEEYYQNLIKEEQQRRADAIREVLGAKTHAQEQQEQAVSEAEQYQRDNAPEIAPISNYQGAFTQQELASMTPEQHEALNNAYNDFVTDKNNVSRTLAETVQTMRGYYNELIGNRQQMQTAVAAHNVTNTQKTQVPTPTRKKEAQARPVVKNGTTTPTTTEQPTNGRRVFTEAETNEYKQRLAEINKDRENLVATFQQSGPFVAATATGPVKINSVNEIDYLMQQRKRQAADEIFAKREQIPTTENATTVPKTADTTDTQASSTPSSTAQPVVQQQPTQVQQKQAQPKERQNVEQPQAATQPQPVASQQTQQNAPQQPTVQQNRPAAETATTASTTEAQPQAQPTTENVAEQEEKLPQDDFRSQTGVAQYQPTEAEREQAKQDIAQQRQEQLISSVRNNRKLLNTAKAARRGVKSAVKAMERQPQEVRNAVAEVLNSPREQFIDLLNDDLSKKKKGLKKEESAPLTAQANQAFRKGLQLLNEGKSVEEAFDAVKNDISDPKAERKAAKEREKTENKKAKHKVKGEGQNVVTEQKSEELQESETSESGNQNINTESEEGRQEQGESSESAKNQNEAEVRENGSNESGLSELSERETAGTVREDAAGRKAGAVSANEDGTGEALLQTNDEAVRNRPSEQRDSDTGGLSGRTENVRGESDGQDAFRGRLHETLTEFNNTVNELYNDYEDDKVDLQDVKDQVDAQLDELEKQIDKVEEERQKLTPNERTERDYENHYKHITVKIGDKEYKPVIYTGSNGKEVIRWATSSGRLVDRGEKRPLGVLLWYSLIARDFNSGKYPTLNQIAKYLENRHKKSDLREMPKSWQEAIKLAKQFKKEKKELSVVDTTPDANTEYNASTVERSGDEQVKRSLDELITEAKRAFKNAKNFRINRDDLIFTMPNGLEMTVNIKDQIILNAADEAKARKEHGLNEGGIVVEGYAKRLDKGALVALSRESGTGTAYHEAFHTVWDWALNDKEKAAMLKHFKPIAEKLGVAVDEAMADGYRDWKLARQQHKGTIFGKLFQKIKDFIDSARAVLTGAENVNNVYRQIESGRVWNRDAKGRFAKAEDSDKQFLVTNKKITGDTRIPVVDITSNPKFDRSSQNITKTVKALMKDDEGNPIRFTLQGEGPIGRIASVVDGKHLFSSSNKHKSNINSSARQRALSDLRTILESAIYVDKHADTRHGSGTKYIELYAVAGNKNDNTLTRFRIVAKEGDPGSGQFEVSDVKFYDIIKDGIVSASPSKTGGSKVTTMPSDISVAELLDGVKDKNGKDYVTDGKLNYEPGVIKTSIRKQATDKQYMDAIKRGDMDAVQRMVDEKANAVLNDVLLPNDDDEVGFKYHRGPAPTKTFKRYAVLNVTQDGFKAAYAGNKTGTPVGVWLDAQNLQSYTSDVTQFDDGSFATYIPGDTGASFDSKFSPELKQKMIKENGLKAGQSWLLERGGKHSSDVPNFSQMNLKQDENGNKVKSSKEGALPHNKLIFEIEYGITEGGDLTDYVREHGRMMKGKNQGLAKIQPNQYYDFKTNPNAVGNWGIGGTFRIVRLVPHSEVVEQTDKFKREQIEQANKDFESGLISKSDRDKRIKGANAISLQKWVGGYHPEDFNISVESVDNLYKEGQKSKVRDAITYDDNGNIIPLSQRFNPEITDDVRYSIRPSDTPLQRTQKLQEAAESVADMVELNAVTFRDPESQKYMKQQIKKRSNLKGKQADQYAEDFLKRVENIVEIVESFYDKYPDMKAWQQRQIKNVEGKVTLEDLTSVDTLRVQVKKGKKMVWVPLVSAFRKNGEYPINIDLGTLCMKREAADALNQILIEKGYAQKLGPTQLEALKDLLKQYGFLTACDVCFVETKRARMLADANKTAYDWETVLNALGLDDDHELGDERQLSEDQKKKLEEMTSTKKVMVGDVEKKEYQIAFEKYVDPKRKRTKTNGDTGTDLDTGTTADKMYKIANLFKQDPSLAGKLRPETLLTTKKTDELFRRYAGHTDISTVISGMYGSATSKPLNGFNVYDHLSWLKSMNEAKLTKNLDWLYDIGGGRAQSFTDFNPILFVDYVQMMADYEARNMPMHVYTKVPSFVKLFGRTGTMINMSFVPKIVKGVDEDHVGLQWNEKTKEWDYAWHEDSFPVEEAYELRQREDFGGRVGTIAVGVSKAHIEKMMADPRIDMIIPYHRSGMPHSVQVKTGLLNATDYTNYQNIKFPDRYDATMRFAKLTDPDFEEKMKGAEKTVAKYLKEQKRKLVDKYLNYSRILIEEGDPNKAAQTYLDRCRELGCIPVFEMFAYKDGNKEAGIVNPGYYKMLEDFRGYDNNNKPVMQGAVRLKLTDDWEQVLNEALGIREEQKQKISGLKDNKEFLDKAYKILEPPRIDGEIREVMVKRLKGALGNDNVQSLRKDEFHDLLEKVYQEKGISQKEAKGRVERFRNGDGIVYGFAKDGAIYLNEDYFNANTPAHEFTHVWAKVAQSKNPTLWKKGVELLRETEEWNNVVNDPLYEDIVGNDNAVASEVLARVVGEENGKYIESMLRPYQKLNKGEALIAQIKDWIKSFFNEVRSLFDPIKGKPLTYEEFTKMPLKALWDENGQKEFREAVAEAVTKRTKNDVIHADAIELQAEGTLAQQKQAVREQYEGTDKWMKAPNGKPTNLTEDQWVTTQTPQFKEWFGDSKVVDENGDPLVVYHGSNANIESFDTNRGGEGTARWGKGAYFATGYGTAETYAKERTMGNGGEANVIPCFLKAENIFDNEMGARDIPKTKNTAWQKLMDFLKEHNIDLPYIIENSRPGVAAGIAARAFGGDRRYGSWEANAKFREKLQEFGFDGISANLEDGTEYVVFNANQIKDASGNNVSITKDSDNIHYSITSAASKAIDKAEAYVNRNVRKPNMQTAEGRASEIFNNTYNNNKAQTWVAWLKDRRDKFYREWIDKNEALHRVDEFIQNTTGKKLKEEDKIYNRVQVARALANGAADTLVQGSEEAFNALRDSIGKGVDPKDTAAVKRAEDMRKEFKYATVQQALEPIMKKDMDQKYPDYLAKHGINTWRDAFSNYLGARRILELVRLVEDKSLQNITHDRKEFTDFINKHPEYEVFRPKPFSKVHWRRQVLDMAQVEPKLAEQMAKELAKTYKFPKGVSRADLEALVNNAPKEFAKSADIYYQLQRNLLILMEDGHLIPGAIRDKVNTLYKDYCPLMIDYSDTAGLEQAISQFGKGADSIANVNSMLKHVLSLGSERGLISPLESTYKSIQMLTERAERNKVAVHFVKMVANSPELQKTGLLEKVPGKSADAKNCIFTVLMNGEKVAFRTTQEMYGPIVGYDIPAAGIVEGVCRSAAQTLRYGATTSPSFIIRNFIRDTIFAGVSSRNGFVPVIDSFKGMWAYLHNKELRGEFDAMGITAYNYFGSGKNAVRSMDELMGEKDMKYLKDHPLELIKELIKLAPKKFEAWSEIVEASTRMGEYMKARQSGKSMQEAALDARDVTLDFSRSGFYGQRVNMMVPFFNACIQGGDKMYRLLNSKDPATRMRTMRMIGIYIMLPSMICWIFNHDEPWYDELDPHIRMNNWILPGGKIRIPKPQEAGILFGSGLESIMDKMFTQEPHAWKNWISAMKEVLIPNIIPTLGLPMLEWATNYSLFREKAIEGNRLKRLPVEMRYNSSTTEFSKAVGKATGLSPVKLDNTIRGYTGTLGMLAAQLPDMFFEEKQSLPSKPITERAMVRDFFLNSMNMNRTSEDFYDLVNASQQQHAGYGKKGRPTPAVKAINKALRDVSKQQKDIQTITNARNISPDRKRQLIDRKREIIKTIQQTTLKRYRDKFDV